MEKATYLRTINSRAFGEVLIPLGTQDTSSVLLPVGTQDTSSTGDNIDITSFVNTQIINVIVLVFFCGIIGLLGMKANIMNMIVFYKQGLDTTINISFFAMALSDLLGLTFQSWYIICGIPYFEELNLPMVYMDVQFILGGIPREAFTKITCFITAYITAERCLCITFPLHVKQIITPKRTTIIMIIIFLATWSNATLVFVVRYLDWQFYPDLNRTLLGVVVVEYKDIVERCAYINNAFLGVSSLIAVVVFTSILIRKLGQTSAWRQSVQGTQEKADPTSKRDRATMKMVVLIAVILIVTTIPSVALGVATFCEPEFVVGGKYFNLYYIFWSFTFLLGTINSSVNIFFYYRMSTKFRHIFREMLLVCGRRIPDMKTPRV